MKPNLSVALRHPIHGQGAQGPKSQSGPAVSRRAFGAGTAACLAWAAGAAWSHGLSAFASVEGNIVTVEARFSSGRVPRSGDVMIYDAQNALLLQIPLAADGTASFPLMEGAEAGLRIEVKASDGHEDYWLLTPADIAAGHKD
ncbi:MAG: hypothetical protein AAFR47_08345 [Pseudomonadota bacterium]